MRYISCPLKLHRAWQCDQWVINGTTFVLVATNTSFFSLQYFSWRLNLKTLRVSWPQGFFLQVKPCFSFKGQIYYSFERVEQFSRARDVFFAIRLCMIFFQWATACADFLLQTTKDLISRKHLLNFFPAVFFFCAGIFLEENCPTPHPQ